jgi:hypothetical protein
LRLVGANSSAAITGTEQLRGKANYFIGNDPKKWRTNVPTYARVKYQGIYPGVDLVYYGNQAGQLEYDFVVAPGADPGAISLSAVAQGQERNSKLESRNSAPHAAVQIAADGDLVVQLHSGEVRFHKPLVYQEQESGVRSQKSEAKDEIRKSKFENRQSAIGNSARAALSSTPRIVFASRWALTTTPKRLSSTPSSAIPATSAAAALTKPMASPLTPPEMSMSRARPTRVTSPC